ncbi:MAG: methyltransferase domain-containing protein [Anaerolineae bacterium]
MARAPFNVQVYLYRRTGDDAFEYALLKRADLGFWQGVTGGGEDDETPIEAARRETREETGLSPAAPFLQLDTVEPIPAYHFGHSQLWGEDVYIVPQYAFGVEVKDEQLVLSPEHTAYRWLRYAEAYRLLEFDGNRTALWELNQRLRAGESHGDGATKQRTDMYGSEEIDLLVKYYDLVFGISGEAEVAWYLDKARAFGGPVLDLACGTGRLALILAREGFQVTAVDRSAGMLRLFQRKLAAEPAEVRQRVRIRKQRMVDFTLPGKFSTILCCDAFFHNLTVQEEMDCLSRVAAHLAPGGRFVFNLPNPTCAFILKSVEAGGRDLEERGWYRLGDGSGILLVEQAQAGNALDQAVTTTFRITRYDATGQPVERGRASWTTRYLFPYEAIHLLYRCGFEVETLEGDYRGGPVAEGGQLIFVVHKARHADTTPSSGTCGALRKRGCEE